MKTKKVSDASFLKPGREVPHMTKKILACVVLCCLMASSWSCAVYTWKQKPLESIRPERREGLKIYAVQKRTGEKVEFSKEAPARIKGDSVVEEKLIKIAIEKSSIDHPHYFNALTPPFDLSTKDGQVYRVAQWTELENKIVGHAYAPFAVMPLSDIDLVTIREMNLAQTLLFGVGFPLAIIFLGGALADPIAW